MLVLGVRVMYRAVAKSVVHCERCGGDRPFERRSGRRWAHLLGIGVYPLASTGEHLRCTICRTCYRLDLQAVPTAGQMQVALRDATKAAAIAMLHSGDQASRAARTRAVKLVKSAGSADYGEDSLAADLAVLDPAATIGQRPGLRQLMETFAVQLEPHAREWFLARVVQVGLADGSLTAGEREAASTIAGHLGMSQARAEDVILLAEAAQAG